MRKLIILIFILSVSTEFLGFSQGLINNNSYSVIESDNCICINNDNYINIDVGDTISLGTKSNSYVVSFIDQPGRQLIEKKVVLENTNQTI